jgi:hypothetical protein
VFEIIACVQIALAHAVIVNHTVTIIVVYGRSRTSYPAPVAVAPNPCGWRVLSLSPLDHISRRSITCLTAMQRNVHAGKEVVELGYQSPSKLDISRGLTQHIVDYERIDCGRR